MYFMLELNASPLLRRTVHLLFILSASRSAASSGVGQRDITAAAVASTAAAAAASQ